MKRMDDSRAWLVPGATQDSTQWATSSLILVPPLCPNSATVGPMDPTVVIPAAKLPPTLGLEASLGGGNPKPPVNLLDQGGVLCECLVNLKGFCEEMRGIAGVGGITPSILYTRTAKETKDGTSINDLNWQVRKALDVNGDNVKGYGHGAQSQPQMMEVKVKVCEGEGTVPNSTTIPAPHYEGPLLVEFNSIRNGQSQIVREKGRGPHRKVKW